MLTLPLSGSLFPCKGADVYKRQSLCLCFSVVHAEEATAAPGTGSKTETVLPPGTGEVAEVYADENGRKFYTIQTPAGNTFYLVIDFTKETENVYFLDAVAEKDLLALAEKAGNAIPRCV